MARQVVSVLLVVLFVLTDMPVSPSEVIFCYDAQVITPEQRLKRFLFIVVFLCIDAHLAVLDVLHAQWNSREVLNSALGWLSVLSCRPIQPIEADHAVRGSHSKSFRVRHEAESRNAIFGYDKLKILFHRLVNLLFSDLIHTRPDFDDSILSSSHKFDLFLVLSN